MKQRIKEGQFTFHEKYWGAISSDAKEVDSPCGVLTDLTA